MAEQMKEQEVARVDGSAQSETARATASESGVVPASVTPDQVSHETPSLLPWHCEPMVPDQWGEAWRIRSRDDFSVATCWTDPGYADEITPRANARCIVHAVNLFPELVAALKAAKPLAVAGLHWHQQRMNESPRADDAGKEDGLIATLEAIDAALAKAEAK